MNPIILPPAMGKMIGQLVKEKEKSGFKPVKLRLKKLTFCHILPDWRGW